MICPNCESNLSQADLRHRHLKAISLNLMHENLSITDGIYAILSDADVRARIDALGQGKNLNGNDLAAALRTPVDQLEQSNGG
jgi:uncharacterized protein YjbI with pentapeptide repeats